MRRIGFSSSFGGAQRNQTTGRCGGPGFTVGLQRAFAASRYGLSMPSTFSGSVVHRIQMVPESHGLVKTLALDQVLH